MTRCGKGRETNEQFVNRCRILYKNDLFVQDLCDRIEAAPKLDEIREQVLEELESEPEFTEAVRHLKTVWGYR